MSGWAIAGIVVAVVVAVVLFVAWKLLSALSYWGKDGGA